LCKLEGKKIDEKIPLYVYIKLLNTLTGKEAREFMDDGLCVRTCIKCDAVDGKISIQKINIFI